MSLVWNSHLIRCPVFYLKPDRKSIPPSACPLLTSAPFAAHRRRLLFALVLVSNSCRLHSKFFKKPRPLIGRESSTIWKFCLIFYLLTLRRNILTSCFVIWGWLVIFLLIWHWTHGPWTLWEGLSLIWTLLVSKRSYPTVKTALDTWGGGCELLRQVADRL